MNYQNQLSGFNAQSYKNIGKGAIDHHFVVDIFAYWHNSAA
jgi:hypothetical protein